MATTPTGSNRLDRLNAAEAERRRVTTRNGRIPAARPTGRGSGGSRPALVSVQIGGPRRRTKTRKRRSLKAPGPGTVIWSIVALALMVVAIVLQTMVSILAALASLAVVVVAAKVEARKARSAPPPPPRKRAVSRGSGGGAKRNGSPGTGGAKTSRKPAGAGSREPVCSEACQVSKRPKSTCRCKATECKHGSKAGLAAT